MDKVGVRHTGGLGGDRPVCRVDGLNTQQKKNKLVSFEVNVPIHSKMKPNNHD